MRKKALQLISRYALPPNSLGYCGRGTAPEKFKNCILGESCKGVASEVEKFIVLNPYLETISKLTKKDKFDYSVVEAYWLGNDELKKAKNSDYDLLLKYFKRQGVPSWLLADLKKKRPKRFIPTHLFQVLHVGVGKASGSVPYNLETINNCMVRWGRVDSKGKSELSLNLTSLAKKEKGYELIQEEGKYPYRIDFMPTLKRGDIVSVHWKQVVKKLTNDEVKKLKYWTSEVLKSL